MPDNPIFPDLHAQDILGTSSPYEKLSGIYFLIQNGKIMYVGQSINLFGRIANHASSTGVKRFDRFSFIAVEPDNLDLAEQHYIKKFIPPWNKCQLSTELRKAKKQRRPPAKKPPPRKETQSEKDWFWEAFYENNKESIHKTMIKDAYWLYKVLRETPSLSHLTSMQLKKRCLSIKRKEHIDIYKASG